MKTMTALEAKNSFGKFLDASQREPVMVTKKDRPVAALFSMHDLQEMAVAYLPANTKIPEESAELIAVLMQQIRIDSKIAQSKREITEGKGISVDDAFFDDLRAHVKTVSSHK